MTLDYHIIQKQLKPKGFDGFLYSLIITVPFFHNLILRKRLRKVIASSVKSYIELHSNIVSITAKCKKMSREKAIKILPDVEKILHTYIDDSFHKLEKNNFFKSKALEKAANLVLNDIYQLDFITRDNAFSENPNDSNDKELKKFASTLSLRSLPQPNESYGLISRKTDGSP